MPAILYRDPRTGQTVPVMQPATGGGVTDHGALTGLADDDHPQYHNDARADARYVNVTGDTMTGALAMDHPTDPADLWFQRNGALRWVLRRESNPETGLNAGSDLSLVSRTDAGGILGYPITVTRSTGEVHLAMDPISADGAATRNYVDARGRWYPYTLTVKQGPSTVVAGTTNRARYALIGKTVHVAVHWTATATGTADFIQVGLPAGMFPASYYDIGEALISNGTAYTACVGLNDYNGDAVRLLRTDNGQYYATALAPNHVIFLNMTYEKTT